MTVRFGLLALLEAQPGKGEELRAFLEAGRAIAASESGTVTWYAFKISDTSYGIFDTFETEQARQAHLDGEIRGRLVRRPRPARRRAQHPNGGGPRPDLTGAIPDVPPGCRDLEVAVLRPVRWRFRGR